MAKNIIIIAAPFGYGPAAKALLIAEALKDRAALTLFTNRDAFHFVRRHCGPDVACREGVFHSAFPELSDLQRFDVFVSVDNEPAVHHLAARGLAGRTIFVDDLLAWRSRSGAAGVHEAVLGYVAEDFPGASAALESCRAARVALTAPLIWNRPARPGPAPGEHGGILLHVGGVTSPLVGWDVLQPPIGAFVDRAARLARRHDRPLTVVGTRHLASLGVADLAGVRILPEASPSETAALVGRSELLLTTPGIGVVHEALACGVPIVLLPATNSTQLYQYGILTDRGFAGSIPDGVRERLLQAGASLPWAEQTVFSVNWLRANLPTALAGLEVRVERLLAGPDGGPARDELLRRQSAFRASLATTDPLAVIRELVG